MILIVEAIILGIIQGLTEFSPHQQSGHLILAQWATGWQGELMNSLTFDVALHFGTLTAVMWYFWRDWLKLGKAMLRVVQGKAMAYEAKLVWYIVLGTIPAVIVGLTLEHMVETAFRNPLLVAGALVFGSLLMWLADRYSSRTRHLGT